MTKGICALISSSRRARADRRCGGSARRAVCSSREDGAIANSRQIGSIPSFLALAWMVTIAVARAHLGVKTQRQWTDSAIARTNPGTFGTYSLASLCAGILLTNSTIHFAIAGYRKTSLTFSNAVGAVRLQLWLGDFDQRFRRTAKRNMLLNPVICKNAQG
jgi:hypothetical protein